MFMHLLSNVLVVFRKKKVFHCTYPFLATEFCKLVVILQIELCWLTKKF